MKKICCHIFCILAAALQLHAQELGLKDCLEMAERNCVTVKNAGLDVLSAEFRLKEARWERYPSASINALSYKAMDPLLKITLHDVLGNSDRANELNEELSARARENGIKPYYSSFADGWSLGLSAVQPVYAGGRIRAGNKLAALNVDAKKIQASIVLRDCRDSVERKYWRIVEMQEKEKTAEGALRLLDTLCKDLGSATDAGLATQHELMQLKLKRNEMAAARRRLANGIRLLKMDLLTDIGCPFEFLKLDDIRLCDTLPCLPAPAEVIADESSLPGFDESRLLALRTEAGRLEKKMGVGELLPQFSIGGAYGYGSMSAAGNGKFNGLVFASLQVPVTGLGKAAQRSKRLQTEIMKSLNEQETYDAKLMLQMRMLAMEIENAWDDMSTAAEAVRIAEDWMSAMRRNYAAGRCTGAQLMQAETELMQASDALNSARTSYRNALNSYTKHLNTTTKQP